ncbi:hypothetical protein REPUB_Repub02eG0080600 [Reevesia pubescens]
MAPSLEFPFTSAQWKELERQAMIYRYMKVSVPIPPNLLIPIVGSPSVPVASHSTLGGGALNLRFSSRGDLELGRCRRTNEKKNGDALEMWHLTKSIVSVTRIEVFLVLESLWNFLTRRLAIPILNLFIHLPPLFSLRMLLQLSLLELLLSLSNRIRPLVFLICQEKNMQYFGLSPLFLPTRNLEDQQRASGILFLNSEMVSLEKSPEGSQKGFIDAWSTSLSYDLNANSRAVETFLVSPCLLGCFHTWRPTRQVLKPSKIATAITATEGSFNPSSPVTGNENSFSPSATVVSSPYGVLQRTLASLSVSSGSSSPKLASSRAKPDISLMLLKGN